MLRLRRTASASTAAEPKATQKARVVKRGERRATGGQTGAEGDRHCSHQRPSPARRRSPACASRDESPDQRAAARHVIVVHWQQVTGKQARSIDRAGRSSRYEPSALNPPENPKSKSWSANARETGWIILATNRQIKRLEAICAEVVSTDGTQVGTPRPYLAGSPDAVDGAAAFIARDPGIRSVPLRRGRPLHFRAPAAENRAGAALGPAAIHAGAPP